MERPVQPEPGPLGTSLSASHREAPWGDPHNMKSRMLMQPAVQPPGFSNGNARTERISRKKSQVLKLVDKPWLLRRVPFHECRGKKTCRPGRSMTGLSRFQQVHRPSRRVRTCLVPKPVAASAAGAQVGLHSPCDSRFCV